MNLKKSLLFQPLESDVNTTLGFYLMMSMSKLNIRCRGRQ